jgi:hypothetical protein
MMLINPAKWLRSMTSCTKGQQIFEDFPLSSFPGSAKPSSHDPEQQCSDAAGSIATIGSIINIQYGRLSITDSLKRFSTTNQPLETPHRFD